MPTQFCFEHVFRATSPDAVLAAYFDPANVVDQDRMLDVVERTIVELVDSGTTLRRTCKIVPRRQLPAVVRTFASAPLHYLETATWDRGRQEIAIEIQPSILKKSQKPAIRALYRLSRLSDGEIHRRYEGTVSVDLALFSSRIERGIVAEFERSVPVAAACTQAFLDRNKSSCSAHA